MRLNTFQRKLVRELWKIRGQAIAIALVIAAGVSMFVLMFSAFGSLELTQQTYYDRFRFADVFASLTRAPEGLARDIEEIPGVAQVETRVVAGVNLMVPGLDRPATGLLISIPEVRRNLLNDLFLRRGRYIDPNRDDEVLVRESFAVANGLDLGDKVVAVIDGRRKELRIVGLALSPEFVYAIRPGELIADDRLFGIFWMGERALAAAYDMRGGFNDVLVRLEPHGSSQEVIDRLDELLEPYGGLGAIPRDLQSSHFYLQSELDGLKGSGTVLPSIFLAVAALLLNVVLARILAVQREQIAVLKALGYSNAAIAWHYLQWSLVIAGSGSILGVASGAWAGLAMTRLYISFFQFPILEYRLDFWVVFLAVGVSLAAATLGAWIAVRRVVLLPPAEAMRPEPPAEYHETWLERAGAKRLMSQPTRMIVRHLRRHPGRVAISVVGIAVGGALLIVGTFTLDSTNHLLDVQFNLAQRYDAMVTFTHPASARSLHEVRRLPGVLSAEAFRAVPARLRFEHRSRNVAITGLPAASELNRIFDQDGRIVPIPSHGLMLSAKLAEILGLETGDVVRAEVLVDSRPVRQIPVTRIVEDNMGTNAYMQIDALRRMMQEGDTLSGAFLEIDPTYSSALYTATQETPAIVALSLKNQARESFESTIGRSFAVVRSIATMFAAIVAFGVVYNMARVSLSERSRELATLRVIGFHRTEIGYILLGELAAVTLVALPLVVLFGWGMAHWMATLYDTEVFRLPVVIGKGTFALALTTVALSAWASGWIVWRKLLRLDLISVLKTRE